MRTANQHSWPHWPDLEEHMVLRLPGELYDRITADAAARNLTPAEAVRRHLLHAYTGQTVPDTNPTTYRPPIGSPLSDEQVIAAADAWADAYWRGTLSPHGDHGPIIAVIERLRRLVGIVTP